MLRDEDIYCRRNAVNVLAAIGPDAGSAVPELIQALKDDDLWVNYFAAVALGKIGKGAREAVPGLVKLYKSEKASVSYLGLGNEDRFLYPGIDKIGQVAALALKEIDPEAAKKAGIR